MPEEQDKRYTNKELSKTYFRVATPIATHEEEVDEGLLGKLKDKRRKIGKLGRNIQNYFTKYGDFRCLDYEGISDQETYMILKLILTHGEEEAKKYVDEIVMREIEEEQKRNKKYFELEDRGKLRVREGYDHLKEGEWDDAVKRAEQ